MMSLFISLTLLVNFSIILQGLATLSPSDGHGGVYEDLMWTAQLCCQVPSVQSVRSQLAVTSGLSGQCQLINDTKPESSRKSQPLSGKCLDISCLFEGERANLICNAKSHGAALSTVSPQQLVFEMGLLSNETNRTTQCSGEDTATCSISLHGNDSIVSLSISLSVNGTTAMSPKMQINTYHLRTPEPPVNLYYNVTTEGEVIFRWSYTQPDSCEVRYSTNSSRHQWEVVKIKGRSWVHLNELSSGVRYMVQVRCQNSFDYWSEWSQPFYFTLDAMPMSNVEEAERNFNYDEYYGVSYIPTEIFTTPDSDVTLYAVFHNRSWSASKAVWLLNGQVKIPESQYRVINERVSAVTLQATGPGFDSLMCCHPWGERFKCTIAYAKMYTEGMFNADITCQSKNSKVDTMTCEWNKSAWAEVRFLYRQYKSMCEDVLKMDNDEDAEELSAPVKECPYGAGDHRECTLSNLSLFSCYKIWLEVEGGRGKVRSLPVYVAPIDYVKPSPPSDLEAITLPKKTLNVRWRRPPLPVYEMQYELRFSALRGMANMHWEVIGPFLKPQAEILLEESCVQYKVEVRCKRLNGPGFWSNWSKSRSSVVYNRKAPEKGPDFWRIIQEDPVRNVSNVTLILPVTAGDPNSCAEGLVIVHHAAGGVVWTNETSLVPFYSFLWRRETHTVSVLSRNSLGVSTWNRNITLLHQPKRRSVRSFSAVANASCVHLSWTLLSDQPVPQSFVIEWLDLNKGPEQNRSSTERTQWVRVKPNARDLCLCRRFYGSEKFTLYPVFVDGEGESVQCTATRGDPAAYMLLMIIVFLSMVLFITLMMSQNHMKKLMWKDIPNPYNCSWAKGMDFRQIETMENLFPHPEGLTACPLLLVSERICEMEIFDKPQALECGKDNNSVNIERTSTSSPLLGDSSEPLSLETSASATPETSGQSSVMYSAILLSDPPGLLRKQQESLSSSSDEGNFSANNSDISGSFPGGLWDLENPVCSDSGNPRHSSSYNSVEELSETSEYEASEGTGGGKDLYYLAVNEKEEMEEDEENDDESESEDAQDEQDENEESQLCKGEFVMKADTKPQTEGNNYTSIDSNTTSHSIPLYLPQFQTEGIDPP